VGAHGGPSTPCTRGHRYHFRSGAI
jgi:hypothetical protein